MPGTTIDQLYQLALQRQQSGQIQEAESLFRQILAQQPNHTDGMVALAYLLHQSGRNAEAIDLLRQATRLKPESATYHRNLGTVLASERRWDQAIAAYQCAIDLRPNIPQIHNDLGNALDAKGMTSAAIAAFRHALDLGPGIPGIYNNLGNVLLKDGRIEEAISALRQAIAIDPSFATAYCNLGNAYLAAGKVDEAIDASRTAVSLRPGFAEALNNLGTALHEAGESAEAIASFRQAAAIQPDSPAAQNLLYTIHFHPDFDSRRIGEEHAQWNQRRVRLPAAPPAIVRNRDPNRRLRIGYVSRDFRLHPVGRFLLPILANHNHRDFEIYCYADVLHPDALTARFQAHADQWRSTIGLSDADAARAVEQDKIDILVDLAMHMKGSRLWLFARKPAPLQVTYLAYCSTTGLDTMDYRLTDPYLDPPGSDDACYSERSLHLSPSYWCYQAPEEAPEVGLLPARVAGQITFGCLNNFSKVTGPTMQAWARLIGELPNSRLLLHARQGSHRERLGNYFRDRGVDPGRIEFVGFQPLPEYLRQYQRIDIGLDPFPYAGGTTTCDALWMGVPVVSLAGKTAVSRAGLSILSNIGLCELVAYTETQYVQIAINLATDLGRLEVLRKSLRERMSGSLLMDAPHFVRELETRFREIWRMWCQGKK